MHLALGHVSLKSCAVEKVQEVSKAAFFDLLDVGRREKCLVPGL